MKNGAWAKIATGFRYALLLLALQAAVFAAIIARPPGPAQNEKFDLLAVFGGEPSRVRLAVRLAREGLGRDLVVSDSDPAQLALYFDRFGRPGRAEVLLEPYARTTDENARLVGRIIRKRNIHSVLLITSWYHQPRAYLLLRLALIGSGVDVRLVSSDAAPHRFVTDRLFRVELLKFWGSLGRWGKSILRKRGLVPGKPPTPVD